MPVLARENQLTVPIWRPTSLSIYKRPLRTIKRGWKRKSVTWTASGMSSTVTSTPTNGVGRLPRSRQIIFGLSIYLMKRMKKMLIDFTNCPRNKFRAYGGANGNKINITYEGHSYMLKFPPKPSRSHEVSYTNG